MLHCDEAIWTASRSGSGRARPRGVDTWAGAAAVRRVLGLGAAGRRGAYPPM